jgi:hypothetical protein
MNGHFSLIAAVIAGGALVACGGSGTAGSSNTASPEGGTANDDAAVEAASSTDAVAAEAEAAPPRDPGAPSSTYPAFMPDFGQIQYNGGNVLKSATVVAITWNSDSSQGSFDTFADTLGQTAYWKAATSEYGVGPAGCGAINHVHLSTAAPAQVTDQDIQNMVMMNAGASVAGAADAGTAEGGASAAWPAATGNTIYAFFLPPGTSLQMSSGQGGSGDACSAGIGGYHDQVTVGSTTASYAVVPSCTFPGGNTPAQQTTMSMSHELIEAVTDPHPQDNNPGWVGFDTAHFGFDWFQEFSDETGDACELFRESFFEDKETTPVAFDYWVQRSWSNNAGPAGHDPCQPAPAAPYFNVTPLNLGTVGVTLPAQLSSTNMAQTIMTRGLHIAVGETQTIELGFYSDGPTGGPWTLRTSLGSPLSQSMPTYLTVTLDKTSGQNGEKAYASVKVNSAGRLKAELLVFHSSMGGVSHYMPVVIGSE